MHSCQDHTVCIESALQQADHICQERGVRFTDLRRRVLEMIWASHAPAKAYDILDRLKSENETPKPPTVYRTLDFLLEHGLIHKLHSLNAYVGCSHPLQHSECYFLICHDCGEIKECCNHTLAQAITGTASQNKFTPSGIALEIGGQCQQCSQHPPKAGPKVSPKVN